MSMSFFLRQALRSHRVLYPRRPFHYSPRNQSIFQEISKKLKGEIDSNPELQKSIKEFKEKADDFKSRTKETAEHLYKHVDAAREEAETRAKQVSSVIKEKISEASEQVRGSVIPRADKSQEGARDEKTEEAFKAGIAEDAAKAEEAPNAQDSSKAPNAQEASKAPNAQEASKVPNAEEASKPRESPDAQEVPKEDKEHGGTDSSQQKAQQSAPGGGAFAGKVKSVLDSMRIGSVASVAKDGYNLIVEELTSTRKVKKSKPGFSRSSATDIVPVAKKTTGWRKHLDDLKEKATSHPLYRRFKNVKDHPVVQKTNEIADEMRDRWETSDSPVVHKIQDLNESFFGETATAAAFKEIRSRDPTFSFPDFVLEVQEDIRPILTAYLKGDYDTLRKKVCKEVVERCRAEHRALQSQGLYVDTKILYISELEVRESKLIGNEPVIIISFQTQQNYCVRDEFGHIREGSKDDIRTILYAWAMQQVSLDEMDPDEFTPRWRLREMQQTGFPAII
ncbi:mitochondrial import inner membrane translocase subunit TIM44-2 [Selaginella moellendorffii]|uniref:mitochondrial import inner membrane translocase subunit TIM44-2 n=1 Tax=Selaginella moellendorffii TaxID=88036 RepID=UPI000D1CC4AA|nr:mitochondrial import inner membrane translocase subunit TIM44-2 [Selaginella moellendorffii]|eukprot:XP_024525373.1 mitochondrial import inner membrane translocase subunit TIM44-2 [Selaginella moellendorffii]